MVPTTSIDASNRNPASSPSLQLTALSPTTITQGQQFFILPNFVDPDGTVAQIQLFANGTAAAGGTIGNPQQGQILIDGHDIRTFTIKSLRDQMTVVMQEARLFNQTVRENIGFGKVAATAEDIVQAAKLAQAHDFIMQMPEGFDSLVGERGGHLSVGQRQRIGIARAFLKDAPILVLDEPTSALDPTTEAAIMTIIEELMRGRTTLIVTHRIATVHQIGKVAVLKNGNGQTEEPAA